MARLLQTRDTFKTDADPYAHRAYRSKYARGYGAEGAHEGKTGIGEFKPMQAPEAAGPLKLGHEKAPGHTQGLSPKEQTYKKDDAANAKQKKTNHKTKPNPF
jgi:hypothetical protein